MLTVVTWLWRGWRPVYKPEHVLIMRNMLAQHLRIPHRFICVTDEDVPGVECVPNWSTPVQGRGGLPDCYRRLKLFAMPGEWLSIDLDAVILGDITSLIERVRGVDFAAVKGTVCDYNGSMWYVNGGRRADVWTDLSPALITVAKSRRTERGAKPIGSDQAIMAYKLPGAPVWTREDGVYQYVWGNRRNMINPKIVFFAGARKPWDTVEFKDDYLAAR